MGPFILGGSMKIKTTISTLFLALGLVGAAGAGQVEISTNDINFKSIQHDQQGVLKVTGPKGFYQEFKVSEGQASLPLYELGLKQDGLYSYELLLLSEQGQETITDARNGRDNAVRKIVVSEKITGDFRVENGGVTETALEDGSENPKEQFGVNYER